ncbi:MAG: NAD(P)/FAD-dependent oxidoreductase [Chloroflexota bacterium]|nr:NAD(P)/FAD-dependent oxidoreductase [Chloroflexota bacterium]
MDVLVLGGGPAGVTAALRAAELGAEVTLLERTLLGGTCTDDGCAPTRVLARAARLVRDAAQAPAYGIELPPADVDFAALLSETQRIVYRLHEKKQLRHHLERVGVTVHEGVGGARFVGRGSVGLPDGRRLEADRIIVCVGGHARRLPIPGGELALTHSDIWGLDRLPGSMSIVGGAATGVQLATIFESFGTQVRLLEMAPRLLPAEDELISTTLAASLQQRGVEVITGIDGVERLERWRGGVRLVYRDAAGTERLCEDQLAVFAVGWPANVEELEPSAGGVRTERGRIVVDDTLRTTAANVFAAGDATGRMMLVQSAIIEGRVAATNAVTDGHQMAAHGIVPHGGFTDPEYGSVGLTEDAAAARHGPIVAATVPYTDIDRAVVDGRTEGACKLVFSADGRRLLGAHVVGEQAVEVVQLAAAAMAADMTADALGSVELAYPTYTSIIGLTARQVMRQVRAREEGRLARSDGSSPEWESRSPS